MESRWTPEFLEGDCKGQNSMAWSVPYIIGKLLERRCLKWARIAHLHIWNTSYGQKNIWESSWQFDSRPLKVKNRPNSLAYKQHATYCWKAFDEGYNFALDFISIGGLLKKLWRPNFGNFRTKSHLDVGPVERCKVYYKGEGGGFPQVRPVVSLVCSNCPWFILAPKVLQLRTNHLMLVLCRPVWVIEACQFFLVPSRSSSTPLYLSKVLWTKERAPTAYSSIVFYLGPTFESLKELGMRH
jgi:hypothetical protein